MTVVFQWGLFGGLQLEAAFGHVLLGSMGILAFGIEILLQKSRLYGDRPHSRGGTCVSVFRERDVPIRRFRKYGAESTGKGTSGDQKV